MKQEIKMINLKLVNCYLVKTEEGFLLFDTGGPVIMDNPYTDRCTELENQLEKEGCVPGSLKVIVLTHGDIDHAFNAAYLREKYGAIIAMHQEDVELVKNLTIDKMMESFHYRSPILNMIFFFLKKKLRGISVRQLDKFKQFSPDVLLKDGDSLSQYGFDAQVLHLPGHTEGSIGFLAKGGELICGDTFTYIKKAAPAPNAYDFKQLKSSIKKLKSMNISKIYPGHGRPFLASELKK